MQPRLRVQHAGGERGTATKRRPAEARGPMEPLLDRLDEDINRLDSALSLVSSPGPAGSIIHDPAYAIGTTPPHTHRALPEHGVSSAPSTSRHIVEIADADGVVANLARAYESSTLNDVVFVLRAPTCRGADAAEADVDQVEAMGAVVAAQSPGLKALIYGDVRSGWFGASSPNGMRTEKAEIVIDLPGERFSVASSLLPVAGLVSDASSGKSTYERSSAAQSTRPWSAAEFRQLVRFCHTGQVSLAAGAAQTLALALCAEYYAVATLTEICSRFIARRLEAWEPFLCVFLQSICGVRAFATLEQAVGCLQTFP